MPRLPTVDRFVAPDDKSREQMLKLNSMATESIVN
jgi:hypothetical protein